MVYTDHIILSVEKKNWLFFPLYTTLLWLILIITIIIIIIYKSNSTRPEKLVKYFNR